MKKVDVREKMIALLDSKQTYGVATWESPNIITRNEEIADFLVANGVVISNLETPTMQCWKSVYDPPKRMRAVIVLYKDNSGLQVGGGYVNDFGIWTLMGDVKGIIKYWMPLELPIGG